MPFLHNETTKVSKLIILTTHPIQYQTPLWQALARDGRTPVEVWFLSDHGLVASYDREFGRTFAWDLDLLSGYKYKLLGKGVALGRYIDLRLPSGFARMLREQEAKAVWLQGWQVLAYWQAAVLCKIQGIEVWLRGEANNFRKIPMSRSIAKKVALGGLFICVDKFFYIGSANKSFYESYRIQPGRLLPAPYCVDNARFRAQAQINRSRRGQLRNKFAIPENAFCVLFCGKLIEKKRPFDVIEGCQRFRATTAVPTHILFVGSGHLEAQVRQASKAFEAQGGSVSFAGFLNQTEIGEAYVAADCMVLASDAGETWGLVVNEALASGLPCIASDSCGSANDLVGAADPKLVYPMGDAEALARSLRHLHEIDGKSVLSPVEGHDFNVTIDSIAAAWEACQK